MVDWCAALMDRRCPLRQIACRFHIKKRPWRNAHAFFGRQHLMIVVTRGVLCCQIDDERYRIDAGQVLVTGPGSIRVLSSWPERPRAEHINLRFQLLDRKGDNLSCCQRPELRGDAFGLPALLALIRDAEEGQGAHNEWQIRSLLSALVSAVADLPLAAEAHEGLSQPQRQQLLDFVDRHPGKGIGVSDLARAVGLSTDYFSRRFRQSFACPPRTWLVRHTIKRACELLQDHDMSIEQVAAELGYDTATFFCRQFREVMQCSASAYRKGVGD